MKTYYFTETRKKAKFGFDVEQFIYVINKGVPCLLATHRYNTGSCKGEHSEAFKGLVIAGLLPIKYLHKYDYDIPHKMYKM